MNGCLTSGHPSPPEVQTCGQHRPSAEASRADVRLSQRFFRNFALILAAVGALIVGVGFWLRTVFVEAAGAAVVLQPLVTGNLALWMVWVWVDDVARLRFPHAPELRGDCCGVTLGISFFSAIGGLALSGAPGGDEAVACALFIGLPTLAVVVPLLRDTTRRLASRRLRALVLTGFVVACMWVQGRVDFTAGDASPLVVNSYLVGLAFAAWLLTWAASPVVRRTA